MQMEEYRDLPMASHDMAIMTSPKTAELFNRLIQQEEALAALLQGQIADHRAMSDAR